MCAICGTYGFSDRELLQQMCDVMMHRGPDDEGFYVGDQVGLGMRRLSIIDVRGGHQPICNEDRTVWVVFNGEIYNFRELRVELEKRGHHFRTGTDTEVLVHAYEEFGDSLVQRIRGMFAFAIWDSRTRRLLLARDRVGMKPLYYRWQCGRLWFASEIKGILQSGCSRELDFFALHEYFSLAHVPAPRTIFKDIRKLLPGHILVCSDGSMSVHRYWDPMPPKRRTLDWDSAKAETRRLLEESVREHLVSDVPLGAFLSGGVDSTAIVAFMARHSQEAVRTFSLGFEKRACYFDELAYARIAAAHFGTRHTEIPVTVDVVDLLPQVISHFDEPFANDTALVMYLLSKEVRRHVTVVLSGTGGDELFAGYNRYVGMRLAELYSKAPRLLRKVMADVVAQVISERVDGRHFPRWLREFTAAGLVGSEDRYLSWVTYFSEEAKHELYGDLLRELCNGASGASIVQSCLRALDDRRDYGDAMFYADVKEYLPNDQLEYSEKMSMAHSLELRVPFCDHRLVEFCASVPLSLKTRGFRPKRLLKEALRGLVPDQIIDRPKHGLHAPIGIWLQTDLAPLLGRLLSREVVERRGYFRYQAIQKLIGLHNSGKRDLSWQIWMLLVFELWHMAYLDGGITATQWSHLGDRWA